VNQDFFFCFNYSIFLNNIEFLIPISLQPDGADLLICQTKIIRPKIIRSLKYLRSTTFGLQKYKNLKFTVANAQYTVTENIRIQCFLLKFLRKMFEFIFKVLRANSIIIHSYSIWYKVIIINCLQKIREVIGHRDKMIISYLWTISFFWFSTFKRKKK